MAGEVAEREDFEVDAKKLEDELIEIDQEVLQEKGLVSPVKKRGKKEASPMKTPSTDASAKFGFV